MRKLIYILGILLLFPSVAIALEDNTEELRETPQADEVTLSAATEEDFDVSKPNYLLKDKLTFTSEDGPISEVQLFGAYRGGLDFRWNDTYTTTYDNLNPEVGFTGTLKNKDWSFKSSYFPWQQKGKYMRSFFSDTYIVNSSIPHNQIYLGYSRVNVGNEGGLSPYILPFVNRSQLARNFGNTRSLNVKVVGDYQYADYNVSLGSSSHSLIGGFTGTEFNAWVNAKPFGNKSKKYGKLTVGGGLNAGHYHNNYTVLSGAVKYEKDKLWASVEAGIADGYNGSLGYNSDQASGYVGTIGYRITPKLEILGRYDQFNTDETEREYTAGLNYYIKGQGLKFSLNYIFHQASQCSNRIIAALQILL